MADNYDIPSDEGDRPLGTAGDFAKAVGAGAAAVGSNLAAASRYFYEAGKSEKGAALSKSLQDMFNATGEGITGSMNDETQKLLSAGLTSKEFWEHPILSTALKGANMTPSMAAIMIPGGLAGTAIGATVAAAGAGGVLSAGQVLDEFYKKADEKKDDELQAEVPYYKQLRDFGYDEAAARAAWHEKSLGMAPALNAILGAALGVVGPAGTAARKLAGANTARALGREGESRLASTAKGALEGVTTEAAQEGVADLSTQSSLVEAGLQKEIDYAQSGAAALEGGYMGGLFGGVVGAATARRGGKASGQSASDAPVDTTGTSPTPAPPPQVDTSIGNPESAPVRSQRDFSKEPKAGQGNPVSVVEGAVAPDAAQMVAVETKKQPLAVAPTEVAAAEQQGAPPEVVAASQRIAQAQPQTAPEPVSVAPEAPPVAQAEQPTTPVDTGMNLPESPDTIRAQFEQLASGERAAVMLPMGTKIDPGTLPEGVAGVMRAQRTPRGVFFYNPKLVTANDILKASAQGKENLILDLGPINKAEAMTRVQQGEQPVGVVERTPEGVEVRAAAGTTETAPAQLAAIQQAASPGNTVAVENPVDTLAARGAPPRTGRVLRNLNAPDLSVKLENRSDEGVKVVKGKNLTKAEKAAVENARKVVPEIANRFAPVEGEDATATLTRAGAIVAAAEEAGIKIPQKIKDSVRGDNAASIPEMVTLVEARDLLRKAKRSKSGKGKAVDEAVVNFRTREADVRAGRSDDVRTARRTEGDMANKRTAQVDDAAASTAATPETVLEGKQEAEQASSSQDDFVAAPAADKIDAEGDRVQTKAAASAKGPVRGISDGSDRAPSEVRKVTVSDEEKRAMIERLNAAAKKPTRTEMAIETSKRISAAAREVERNPTQAQIDAGNYAKGHVSVQGLDIAIENPRGAMRRGTDPATGRQWAVKVPDHYGYIKGFKSADGDHIDVFVGRNPTSDRVFVIDQMDANTKLFDEHKVMLGYRDEAQALDAYRKAFSDGRADERIGNIHEYNVAEFKDFLKNGDLNRPAVDNALQASSDQQDVIHHRTGVKKTTMLTERADTLLNGLDTSQMTDVPKRLAEFFKKEMAKLVGDTPVHFLSKEDFAEMTGRDVGSARGMYVNDEGGPRIYVDAAEAQDANGLAHVVLHEAMHRVALSEINANPTLKKVIRGMMSDTQGHMLRDMDAETYNRYSYAFTNEHEFMSEAIGNAGFQNILAQIPAGKPTIDTLQLRDVSLSNMFDRVVFTVKTLIEKALGRRLPVGPKMIAGVLRTSEYIFDARRRDMEFGSLLGEPDSAFLERNPVSSYVTETGGNILNAARETVEQLRAAPSMSNPERAPFALALRTFDNVAQIAANYWRDANPVRRIQQAVERQRVAAGDYLRGYEPVMKAFDKLRREDPAQFEAMNDLMYDASQLKVHPDVALDDPKNKHMGKSDTLKFAQARRQHPTLARRYAELSPQAKEVYQRTVGQFTKEQNTLRRKLIQNVVELQIGKRDDAMADRFFNKTATEADIEAIGGMQHVKDYDSLAKLDGPYVPFIRRGDFVIKGKYTLPTPDGARKIDDNTFEFTDRKAASDYAGSQRLPADVSSVWVDSTTGLTYSTNAEGKQFRIIKEDPTAVQRFRVEVENQYTEFAKTKREAVRRHQELASEEGLVLDGLEPKKYEPNRGSAGDITGAMGSLARRIERSTAFKEASPTQQAAVMAGIREASIGATSGTKLANKALPRRGVAGYSRDTLQNMYDYAQSTSHYKAKLDYAPEIGRNVKEMEATVAQDASKESSFARRSIADDVKKRLENANELEQGGVLAPVTKRLLALSFVDKLASPAYSMINATQPMMITMPYLAGKHGVSRAITVLGKAYADVSALDIVREGAKGTGRRIKGADESTDLMGMVKRNLSADEARAIDQGVELGVIDADAGMEISRLAKDYTGLGGKVDTAIGYLEGISREMPRAVETINRSVAMLAAYRLERARGADHDAAVQYAVDTVNNTQFNYAPTNSPKIFSHPLAKLALQFKKYGQAMYQLIGMQIGKAMRNANEGDRAEAIKVLMGIAATHTAMAGAMGLPTEPFKYLVMGANAAGLTSTTWGDVENKVREGAASTFGKTGGEVLTKGLPRLLNIDLSTRMGLDSVTSFGEPRSQKQEDVKTWLFDNLAGPVAGLAGDWIKGLNNLTDGNVTKAAEQLIPMKVMADSVRAYRQFTEGKQSAAGRQTSEPYSVGEAGMRVLGLGSGREANEGARTGAIRSQSKQQSDQRSKLMNDWIKASPSDKTAAFRAITKWNADRPKDARITMAELTSKARRETSLKPKLQNGLQPNKRDQYIFDRANDTY